ncbi:Nucleolar protein 10 [Intoshia linei]|uniref:Nucleolar protein 10 n=1 Tax=Intoshia linei TaxID=1819745 RepID=A0A177ARK6_9BILA|nr:Nucleolar protein 10 [Intoshia linei]
MKLTSPNNVKIYCLANELSKPDWSSKKKYKSVDQNNVINIIQDLEMPTVSKTVCMTADGNYMIASGTYKPRIRCYDLNEMTLKFERCVDYEVLKVLPLSEDYSKLLLLQENRFVEFHSSEGKYHRIRVPHFSRDVDLYALSGQLLLTGTSSEVIRFDCNLGRFIKPLLCTDESLHPISAINTITTNEQHGLIIGGNDVGIVNAWDIRTKNESISYMDVRQANLKCGEITSCSFLKNYLDLAVGTESGQVFIYDIRSQKPRLVKDHNYAVPIKGILSNSNILDENILNENDKVLYTFDSRVLKIWNSENGNAITAIELEYDVNDVSVVENSGLMFIAGESPSIVPFFVGEIGHAPKWCKYLDKITDDFDSAGVQCESGNLYDDFTFITRDEVIRIGLAHLIGTSSLTAYMHGYYVQNGVYRGAKDKYEIFNLSKYQKTKREAEPVQMNEIVQGCIESLSGKVCTTNTGLLDRCEQILQSGDRKQIKSTHSLLNDTRFSNIFVNKDFEIDVNSIDFKLLNSGVSLLQKYETSKQNVSTSKILSFDLNPVKQIKKPIKKPTIKQARILNTNQSSIAILSESLKEENTNQESILKDVMNC